MQPQQCENSAGIGNFGCPLYDSKHAATGLKSGLKYMSLLLMIAQTQYSQKNVTEKLLCIQSVAGLNAMGLTRIEAICTCLTRHVMFTAATALSSK